MPENKPDSDTEKSDPSGTPGGLPPETVEDRPDGSQVTPEDYPEEERKIATGDGGSDPQAHGAYVAPEPGTDPMHEGP